MQAELAAVGAQGGRGCPSPDVTVQLVIYQTGRPVLNTLFFYNYEHPKKGQLPILLSRLARDS